MRTIIFIVIFALSSAVGFAQSQITRPKPPKSESTSSNTSTPPTSSSNRQVVSGKTFTANGVTFKMMKVEGGTFSMGATSEQKDPGSNEKPVHQVTLSTFYIGETEVPQALWEAVMGANPSKFKGDNRPVERVSWDDCQTFIKKLNSMTGEKFRLPTESEWEFAARGGNNSHRYQYSGSNILRNVAWYNCDSTHNVKLKCPNELGIYDMSGNVCEWCQDYYGSYDCNPVTNPVGAASGTNRVHRGGSWGHFSWGCSLASRVSEMQNYRISFLGLRLAL